MDPRSFCQTDFDKTLATTYIDTFTHVNNCSSDVFPMCADLDLQKIFIDIISLYSTVFNLLVKKVNQIVYKFYMIMPSISILSLKLGELLQDPALEIQFSDPYFIDVHYFNYLNFSVFIKDRFLFCHPFFTSGNVVSNYESPLKSTFVAPFQ